MSLTKLSLGGIIYNRTSVFPPRESLVSDIPAEEGNIEKLFYGVPSMTAGNQWDCSSLLHLPFWSIMCNGIVCAFLSKIPKIIHFRQHAWCLTFWNSWLYGDSGASSFNSEFYISVKNKHDLSHEKVPLRADSEKRRRRKGFQFNSGISLWIEYYQSLILLDDDL